MLCCAMPRHAMLCHAKLCHALLCCVAEQLRDALSANAVRVIDLFREWDEDGSGSVCKKACPY